MIKIGNPGTKPARIEGPPIRTQTLAAFNIYI